MEITGGGRFLTTDEGLGSEATVTLARTTNRGARFGDFFTTDLNG